MTLLFPEGKFARVVEELGLLFHRNLVSDAASEPIGSGLGQGAAASAAQSRHKTRNGGSNETALLTGDAGNVIWLEVLVTGCWTDIWPGLRRESDWSTGVCSQGSELSVLARCILAGKVGNFRQMAEATLYRQACPKPVFVGAAAEKAPRPQPPWR
ncbi:hypothetical protein BDP67DRAFT_569183 [Colletotrichum lupini]|nr:hypothetical protein BDP67DRAFT_569183 [Colletotrichum lupini]